MSSFKEFILFLKNIKQKLLREKEQFKLFYGWQDKLFTTKIISI